VTKEVEVCIAGGGPAGMVLGLLLAKLGVRVLVLEQHRDFEREYRGEVLMPRFTQMMRQIGLFQDLERSCHHLKLEGLEGFYHKHRILNVNLKEISSDAPFALWMPQPELLKFLYHRAKHFPNFEMMFETSVKSLIQTGNQVQGVIAQTSHGEKIEIKAKVTVGADGRFSAVRRQGGFTVEEEDYHFDLIWFSIPRPKDYDNQVRFFLSEDHNYLILPKYPDLVQCGLIAAKGEYSEFHHRGIESIRSILLHSHPFFREFAESLKDFSPFSVLQARIEYVREWAKNGVLLVGDSAHTCSPAGAVGVSVAVGSAIVAAEVIKDALDAKDVSAARLSKLQELRQEEVRDIQKLQKAFTRNFLGQTGFRKFLMPFQLLIAAKLGFIQILQRRMLARKEPLPVGPKIRI
jgi:2-polyprenyl-6-methoxyphenol hydroxylase-like FAD-dependent oxidoreductase